MSGISYKKLSEFDTLFNGLSSSDLKLISDIVIRKEVEAGSIIIQEGESGSELFFLEEGIVDITRTLTIIASKHEFGTKERSFIRLSGENHCFFGEMSLFGNEERSATVKSVTKCQLLVMRGEDFKKLCNEHPKIGYIVVSNIALIISKYLRKSNDDVIKLTTALSLAFSG